MTNLQPVPTLDDDPYVDVPPPDGPPGWGAEPGRRSWQRVDLDPVQGFFKGRDYGGPPPRFDIAGSGGNAGNAPSEVVLDDIRDFIARFIAFPSDAALTAVALWVAHTHLVHSGESSPRLAVLSPEPSSGKTRTLEIIELLVPRPMSVLSASPAAVFRSIDAEKPTLLLDEVDAIFGSKGSADGAEDLRGLLNAGHRMGATIPRCVGPSHEVHRFAVYAAVALAGLGDLPDTLMSRSVIIRMRRRAPHEVVEPFRNRVHGPQGEALRARLAAWADTVKDEVRDAWPTFPDGVVDRPADVWEPLLAVADAAGAHWPASSRLACVELTRVSESRDASLGVRLLSNLRDIFATDDAMHTETILDRLHRLDEAPWADLYGKPLDPRGLAGRLGKYGVGSTTVKIAGKALKGYQRADLWDAFTRYLPSLDPQVSVTSVTCVTGVLPDPPFAPTAEQAPCRVCGFGMNPVITAEGFDTHPGCD